VTSESTRYLKLLERRLDLLGALSDTLAKSRTDFVSMDLGAMERRIAEQEQFCKQIRSLDADITNAQVRCAQSAGLRPCTDAISWPPATGGDVRQDEQIQITLGRIAAAQVELKRINDSHQAMLRRSKRTVQVLLNLFNSFAPTYSAPGAVGTTYEERV
jgi:hypothetical protein